MTNSIFRIWTNARTEMKLIKRSWFFRIFLTLGMLLLFLMNFVVLTKLDRVVNGLSAFHPYLNVQYFSILQSFLLIFLIVDICTRNRELDSYEVFYTRSMTNGEYLTGQALGLFIVFAALQIMLLIVGGAFNLINPDVNFAWQPYLYYPLLISLPTFLFMTGLTFLLMELLRYQAVVIVVLLGFLGVDLFFAKAQLFSFFDFTAYTLPVLYSDFTRITNLKNIILQRAFYSALGIIFFIITVLFFHRLRQAKILYRVLNFLTLFLLFCALVSGAVYLNSNTKEYKERAFFKKLNKSYSQTTFPTIETCHLDVIHKEDQIQVKSHLVFKNQNPLALKTFVFTLNPGLNVEKILRSSKAVPFVQHDFLIEITLQNSLLPNETDSLEIFYQGKINGNICYLDIPEKAHKEHCSIFSYQIDKKYAFLESGYVLLTSNCLWYPSTRLPRMQNQISIRPPDFTRFTLKVTTNKDLQAISQGKRSELAPGQFSFLAEYPLKELSLVIGKYEHHEISVGDRAYHLYHHPAHDYYKKYFDLSREKIASLIQEIENECYQILPIEYPFSRFSIIEAPIQFFAYKQSKRNERTPPEFSIFHENNILYYESNFKRNLKYMSKHSRIPLTEEEKQTQLYQKFWRSTLTGSYIVDDLTSGKAIGERAYEIFPQLFSNSTYFNSNKLPFFNSIIEEYIDSKSYSNHSAYSPFIIPMAPGGDEMACQAIVSNGLASQAQDSIKWEFVSEINYLKRKLVTNFLLSKVDRNEFEELVFQTINQNQNRMIDADSFLLNVTQKYNFNPNDLIRIREQNNGLPAYEYDNFHLYQIMKDYHIRYQVILDITNVSQSMGVCEIYFRDQKENFDWSRETSQEPDRIVSIAGGAKKRIGFILNTKPVTVTINPIMAQNLPLDFGAYLKPEETPKNFQPFNDERLVEYHKKPDNNNEIIIDNRDPNFTITYSSKSLINRLFRKQQSDENNYENWRTWRPPGKWSLLKHGDFYGPIIKSARYIKSGEGRNFVTWSTKIKESGNYTLYTWFPQKRTFRNKNRSQIQDLNYEIHTNDGIENVRMNFEETSEGWNELGTFYFSKGKAKVVLTDKSQGLLVLADAVKWKKVD